MADRAHTTKEVQLVIESELQQLKERIIANHRTEGQVASGRTIESMQVEITDDGGILWGRQAFGTLETGRKGGNVPKGFYHIILQWVKDKGLDAQVDNPKTFAYFVSKKIAKEGTELYLAGGRNDIYTPEIKRTMESLADKISAIFETDVEHINLNIT